MEIYSRELLSRLVSVHCNLINTARITYVVPDLFHSFHGRALTEADLNYLIIN
jgi:hypothetical protein